METAELYFCHADLFPDEREELPLRKTLRSWSGLISRKSHLPFVQQEVLGDTRSENAVSRLA
jgi:hypothetical protein